MDVPLIAVAGVVLLSCIVLVVVWMMHRQPDTAIVPHKHVVTMERIDAAVRGKPASVALEAIRTGMPGWKTTVFQGDHPQFYKKYDAWDATRSTPDTVVVILDKKGMTMSLTFGPSGGNGWTDSKQWMG